MSFVYFKNNETGDYLESIYGRCDRESTCGYFNSPSSNKPVVNITKIYESKEPSYLNDNVVWKYCNNYDNNNFVTFLLKHFSETNVIQAIERYYIGTSGYWQGSCIFWQIDNNLNIHTGKVMLYDWDTGCRVKKPYPHINWIHKTLSVKQFVLRQCLFGLHLIKDCIRDQTICIVESEKTAIIMSIILPSYIWIATGSKSNLKLELLRPIRDFNIIVYPDKSEYEDWNTQTLKLKCNGYSITCSNLLELSKSQVGADLADLLFN